MGTSSVPKFILSCFPNLVLSLKEVLSVVVLGVLEEEDPAPVMGLTREWHKKCPQGGGSSRTRQRTNKILARGAAVQLCVLVSDPR